MDRYNDIIDRVTHENLSFVDAERELLGMEHARVGGEIVQKWGIPDAIARPILCHHQFEKIQLLDKESCQGQEEAMA